LNVLITGSFNTVLGSTGLQFLTTGSSNVFVGSVLSYCNITTGSSNISIRVGMGSNYTISESNNIIIGTNVEGKICL
jgi:hypothetical protein